MTIPLFKVRMNADVALENLSQVLHSGYVGEGEWCKKLEGELGGLLLNSCTSAITLALDLCGVTHGTEVITTPMTCLATNTPILKLGAKPVWADVDPTTGLIDMEDARKKITTKTKAIILVDWAGRPCPPNDEIYPVPMIFDMAHGSPNTGVKGWDRNSYYCFSFQAIKFLTTGDGGMLVPPLHELERARKMRWFGLDRQSSESMRCHQNIPEAGWKFQSNDVAAAIGMANLVGLDNAVKRHRRNAWFYQERLSGLSKVQMPTYDPDCSYWLYTLLVDDPQGFEAFMAQRGIQVSQVHARNDTQSVFKDSVVPLPGVDAFSARQINIPVGWWVSDDDRDTIVQAIKDWDSA